MLVINNVPQSSAGIEIVLHAMRDRRVQRKSVDTRINREERTIALLEQANERNLVIGPFQKLVGNHDGYVFRAT